MAWSWYYECECQLFLMVPFLVILYHKLGRRVCYVLYSVPIGLGIWINYKSSYAHDLTAGIFSLENFYMYSFYINKPWYKLGCYFVGILSAMFFIDARDYKKSLREGTVDHLEFTTMKFLHRSADRVNGGLLKRLVPFLFVIGAVVGYGCAIFIAFPRMVDPYGWTDSQNAWFYALTRTVWAACTMVLFFWLVLDHNPIMRAMAGAPSNNVLLSLLWPSYILAPLVYMNMYCSVSEAIFMTMINNIYLGMGAMWLTIVFAAVFLLLFANPVETMFDLTIRKYLKVGLQNNGEMKQSIK